MNHSTSNDSETGSEGYPSKPASTLTDLQVKAYENRVRERLIAKYPKRTPAEARRLGKHIEKLVQIYAEGRILLQSDRSDCVRQNLHPQGMSKPDRLKLPMNGNNTQPRVPTLKDLYGPEQSSFPWEEHQAEIVRFWTDSGDCWGFLFHHVSGTYYSAKEQRLLIDGPVELSWSRVRRHSSFTSSFRIIVLHS
jgi:hypothetical protein